MRNSENVTYLVYVRARLGRQIAERLELAVQGHNGLLLGSLVERPKRLAGYCRCRSFVSRVTFARIVSLQAMQDLRVWRYALLHAGLTALLPPLGFASWTPFPPTMKAAMVPLGVRVA